MQVFKKRGKYLTNDGTEVLIQSDSSRSQSENSEECYEKLYKAIVQSANLPGETSVEQRERVQKLSKSYNENRLKQKHKESSKKAARRGGRGGSDY